MKLKYESYRKMIGENLGENTRAFAGYSGWTAYSTSAKTKAGLLKRMREEAEKKLASTIRFYEDYPAARKSDIYDQDHVWFFHTYAPLAGGGTLHFNAFAVKREGVYGEIEYSYYAEGEDSRADYLARFEHYESLVA